MAIPSCSIYGSSVFWSLHAQSVTFLWLWCAVQKSVSVSHGKSNKKLQQILNPQLPIIFSCNPKKTSWLSDPTSQPWSFLHHPSKMKPCMDGKLWLRTTDFMTGSEHVLNMSDLNTYTFLPSQQQTQWWSQSPRMIHDRATQRPVQLALDAAVQRNLGNKHVTYQYHISVIIMNRWRDNITNHCFNIW
jgi:hypothetical protein